MTRARGVPRPAALLWLLMFVAVATGSLLPARELPPAAFDGMDKLEHLAGYALLSGYAVLLFDTRHARLVAMGAVIAFGIAIEIAQGVFTATREPDLLDAVANFVGAGIGQLLAFTPLAGHLRRRA